LRLIRGPPPIRHGLGPCQMSPTFVCGAAEPSFTYNATNELNWTPICSQLSLLAIQMVTRAGSSGIQSQSALLSLKELNSMSSLSLYPNSLLLRLLLSLLAAIVSHCHWKRGGMFLLQLLSFQQQFQLLLSSLRLLRLPFLLRRFLRLPRHLSHLLPCL